MFTLRLLKIKIHSRRVSIFKRSLPIFAFLLTGVMIAWPALNEHKDKFAMATPSKDMLKRSNTDMEDVRFFSKDSRQNPLSVTAAVVREADASRKIISLENPTVRYVMSDGVILTGTTSYGLAFQNEKYLYFEEEVSTQTDTGYLALSEKVVCDYNAGSIGSEQDVFIKGPAGMLKANGFFIKDKGNYLHFKGHTATLLFKEEKPKELISQLEFKQQKTYLSEDKENVFITSEDGLIIQQDEHMVKALKNVDVYQDKNHLEAQSVVVNYQKQEDGAMQIRKITASEQVIMKTPQNQATAHELTVYRDLEEMEQILAQLPGSIRGQEKPTQIVVLTGNAVLKEGKNVVQADKIYALYAGKNNQLLKVVALGHMQATNGMQRILGNYGAYVPDTKIVNVYEKVSLHEKESVLKGEYATLNLKTGISSLKGAQSKSAGSSRIKGQIIPRDFEKEKVSEAK